MQLNAALTRDELVVVDVLFNAVLRERSLPGVHFTQRLNALAFAANARDFNRQSGCDRVDDLFARRNLAVNFFSQKVDELLVYRAERLLVAIG